MICAPALLPELFAQTPIPAGPISDEAADAIALLLWQSVEGKVANHANDREQGGDGDE